MNLQQPLADAGTLTCSIAPGIGLVLGSSRTATCIFDHPGPFFFSETYKANLSRVGIDVGVTTKQAIKWTVYTPDGAANPGELAGVHTGSSTEATVGTGSGAEISLTNAGSTVVLRQLSGTMELGLAVGLGRTSLDLVATREVNALDAH